MYLDQDLGQLGSVQGSLIYIKAKGFSPDLCWESAILVLASSFLGPALAPFSYSREGVRTYWRNSIIKSLN